MVTSISFDAPIYTPGQTITTTVTYQTTNQYTVGNLTTVLTDTLTGESFANVGYLNPPTGGEYWNPSGAFTLSTASGGTPDPVTLDITDTGGRNWIQVSNNLTGSSAPFTGTAVFTATA
jgi:hypothetical protein